MGFKLEKGNDLAEKMKLLRNVHDVVGCRLRKSVEMSVSSL